MKKFTLSIVLLITALSVAQAQDAKTPPRTEFALDLATSSAKVISGQTTSIDLSILRSKTYKKSNAVLGLSSGLPEGISVTFEPESGVIEKSSVKISVSDTTKPGEYLLILKATLQNHTKGATLKLIVEDAANPTATSGR